MTVIPERDVYRLVMRSKLAGAERFEEWVVGEVLPSIRKSGKFEAAAQGSSKVVGELALMECYTRLLPAVKAALKACRFEVKGKLAMRCSPVRSRGLPQNCARGLPR